MTKVKTEEKSKPSIQWSPKEKEDLKNKYGTELLVENANQEQMSNKYLPTDAYVVTYKNAEGNIPKLKAFSHPGNKNASKQIYKGSRIPDNHINDILNKGGKIINATGEAGSYAIHSANILHRASCPQPNTEPRDVLFFFIRPSLKLNNNSLENISSYLPKRDVKQYNLD